jgi:uroporphyrinogen-III decarboxylase
VNHRDRALAAMRGRPVDRIPFIARMDLWYGFHRSRGTLPHPYENATLWDLQRDLGIGIFGFGAWDISFYRMVHDGVEITSEERDGRTITRYETPYGTLTSRDAMSAELAEAAGTAARVEYPFKTDADYDVLQYLIEHTRPVENYEAYGRFMEAIGTDGLALPFSGHLPAHQLMITFMGYSQFYYELCDHPARVETLVRALTDQQRQILRLAAGCPAQAVEVGGNYDEQMTPPPVFDTFFAPFYREARQTLAAGNKILVVHGDGNMRVLLEKLMDCGVQVVEALTPKPMTTIDIPRTRRLWGDRVVMWGGLATVILTDVFTDEEFERFLDDLFAAVAPGDRFILGFGDNVPTDALFDRIRRIARYWADHGAYPVTGEFRID